MIIIFGTPEQVSVNLPDLYVQDSKSKNNIPVAGLEGWDNDFLQTQTITYAPLILQNMGSFSSDGETTVFSCKRLSKLLISLAFSSSGASVDIYPVFFDKNDLQVLGKKLSISATSVTDSSSRYMASVEDVSLNGASKVKLLVKNISSGTVHVLGAGV